MPLPIQGVCTLLQVFDMPRSLAFYREVLGYEVVHSDRPGDDCDWCLLRKDATELMLNTQFERDERPAAADPKRIVGHRDVTLYFRCSDPDAAYAHLRSHGIEATPPINQPYGMRQVYCSDPDGYGICFQRPME